LRRGKIGSSSFSRRITQFSCPNLSECFARRKAVRKIRKSAVRVGLKAHSMPGGSGIAGTTAGPCFFLFSNFLCYLWKLPRPGARRTQELLTLTRINGVVGRPAMFRFGPRLVFANDLTDFGRRTPVYLVRGYRSWSWSHLSGLRRCVPLLAVRCLAGVLETDFPCFGTFPVTSESFPATGPANARALNARSDPAARRLKLLGWMIEQEMIVQCGHA
jgi:hypothetical protein